MTEDAGDDQAAPAASGADDDAQTVEIPISACEGMTPKPGQVLPFKVVSVDANNGVINAVYAAPQGAGGGSDSMASEFNDPQDAGSQSSPPAARGQM
jgi:hypothetical protein